MEDYLDCDEGADPMWLTGLPADVWSSTHPMCGDPHVHYDRVRVIVREAFFVTDVP